MTKLWITFIFLIFLTGCSSAKTSTATAPPSDLRLMLYAPTSSLTQGDACDLIIEVTNPTQNVIKCADYVSLERIVERTDGENHAPTKVERIATKSTNGEFQLTIFCSVPPGNQGKFISPRNRNHHPSSLREISPHQSIFLKVAMPRDAFELGTCNFSAKSTNSTTSSNILRIQCMAP